MTAQNNRRVATRIRNHWQDQEGTRRAYCPVESGIVTVIVPVDHQDGREVVIEQGSDGRWRLIDGAGSC